MPRYDFRSPRIHVEAPLGPGARIALNGDQANYLRNVLRLKAGDPVLVFNGREGEWRAALADTGKRGAALAVTEQTRAQTEALDLHYLFAPLKHARLDFMVQKAVEMGAARLQPVITRHTQVSRVNIERMRANAVEAAEQCGILTLPAVAGPLSLDAALAARDPARLLVFCDEDAEVKDPVAALSAAGVAGAAAGAGGTAAGAAGAAAGVGGGKAPALAVLVGPEGGFSDDERAVLLQQPGVVRLALGPRILRADTAAVAALALVGAVLGDWKG